ncbi:MAG: ABC transporter ATP-binding protein [Lachnospiraceae bacterium]
MVNYLKRKYALSDAGAADLLAGIGYSVLKNISLMLPAALLSLILRAVLPDGADGGGSSVSIMSCTIPGIICLAAMFILHYLQYTRTYIGTYKESARRRITIAEHLRNLPLSFFGERDMTELTGTIMGDCASFEHAFSHTVPQFFGAVISTVIVCGALLLMDVRLGLALLWVAPVAFCIVMLSRRLQERLGTKHIEARHELAAGIQECLETVQDIKSCGAEADYLRKLDAKMDRAEKAQISSEMTSASLITSAQMFLRLGLASVIVVGSNMVLAGETDLFSYTLFLIASSRIYDPLSGALSNMAELFSVQLQVKRLGSIVDYPLQKGAQAFAGRDYSITFERVGFAYDDRKAVLKDVSFTAEQGKVTALVGPSGGGKSTAAKLAARFYDIDSGTIFLGGQDISEVAPAELMKNFAIVFQDVVLFNNTIMENIRTGKQNATDDEVIRAAKMACCDEFIRKMSDGYHTIIGENGSTLSGGECQRISIARALLKDAPVIVLDEATASLDVDSETQVQEAISQLIRGKTVLVIAHRMRTIQSASRIVVLKDGLVAECGTHKELMERQGVYHRMVSLQKMVN